ncbi:MAG: hypothetical protein JWN69_53 [Alphaproteobacteria bacterium]|nr:hypothetical protein [Alphaproteobacteria bacterium]
MTNASPDADRLGRTSFQLAKAIAGGRAAGARPTSREQVLARLLAKRAAAHRAGLHALEQALRAQILWALPMRRDENRAMLEANGPEQHGETARNDRL